MNIHKIELTGYCVKSPEGPALYLGTAGSYGNEQLAVTLGKGWQGLTVKAVFQPSGVPAVVPNGDGTLDVPWEATETALDAAKGRIVFEGVTDGRVLISTDIPYAVGSHSDTEGSNSQPPTPSEWEQYVDEVKGDADRAEQAAKDAEASVQTVKDAGAQAVTDISAAKDSALDAIAKAGEEAAGSISADVQAAKDAAAAAEQSAKDAAAELPKVQQAGQTALDDIATERENSLTALEDEGDKQQSAVAGAGASALEAIQQAGATQVGAVQSAGTTQVGLVNSAGQQQTVNIAYAGSQQAQAVQAAGTAAVGTVNDARDEAVEEIEAANAHSPQINQDTGYWQTWDAETGQYVDTATKAQGPQGNKGDTGNPGPQGETGATPQLTIGTVTTLDPGEDATVTITGTAEAPVLNFGIPKGEQGDGSTSGSDLPATTAADSGKVPTVNAAGTGYELTGPYAPFSAAIRPTASGNPVNITDSVEWPLLGLKVYGKSTQDGVPSPESPVPIVSAGDGGSIALTVSDGAEQSQSLTVSTPTGLPGIPVDSGGNYTDASGQQWMCDEVDLNAKALISNIIKATFNGGFISNGGIVNGLFKAQHTFYESLGLLRIPSICDMFVKGSGDVQRYVISFAILYIQIDASILKNGENSTIDDVNAFFAEHPVTVIAQRSAPITTPLSEEEVAAYRALHTYDGATVVSTAEDVAGLEVKYVADAQKYIDDRLAAAESHIQEIAAAQLNAQTGG